MPTLQVLIDTAQRRIAKEAISLLVDGNQWVFYSNSNTTVDVLTRTGFLTPLPATAGWQTTATGSYARLRKTDYTLITGSKWVEGSHKFAGDYYLHSLDVNEIVTTAATYPKNQGWYLSWVAYNPGNSNFIQIEFAFPGTVGGAGTVFLRFWSDGRVDVYKGTEQVGNGSISGDTAQGQNTPAQTVANQTVEVYLIPMRRNQMMILSNQGTGFVHTFPDIDASDSDPAITQAGAISWQVPAGQATVQVAPLKFLSTGYLIGPVTNLREAPSLGAVPELTVFADAPGYGSPVAPVVSLKAANGTDDFTPDDVSTECRLRVDLSGIGDASYWVYGASATFPPETALTPNDEQTDITEFCRAVSLDVPAFPGDVRATLEMAGPEAIATAGVVDFTEQHNRPIEILLDGVTIFTGRMQAPNLVVSPYDGSTHLTAKAYDEYDALKVYQVKERFPLDGLAASEGIARLVKMAGFEDEDLDIDTTAFLLSQAGHEAKASTGEFDVLVKEGDLPAHWIEQFWKDFADNWRVGFYPRVDGRKFLFKSPATVPERHVFLDEEALKTYLIETLEYTEGKAQGTRYQHVWQHFEEEPLIIACNEVFVWWQNAATGQRNLVHYRDAESQDPTTLPSLRPKNWTGDKRAVVIYDPAITSHDQAVRICETIRDRGTVSPKAAQGRAQFLRKADLTPLWRGDVVNTPDKGVYRILSLSGEFRREYDSGDEEKPWTWRPFTYTLKRFGDAVDPTADAPGASEDMP